MRIPTYLKFILLTAACFSLAVTLQPHAVTWSERAQSDNVLKVLFGDGRRLFANHFFTQADVSFHSGYYPTIFDQAQTPKQSPMISGHHEEHGHEAEEHDEHDEAEKAHEKEMDFLGKPRDWIEAFGRHFIVTEHTHLQKGQEREILPWLRLSASLDPQKVDTYIVASYWLRKRLDKVKEAKDFLQEGLRANPDSPEILFELGSLYKENEHDTQRARNVWELALRRWRETEGKRKEPNKKLLGNITVNLGRLEEEAGNLDKAIYYLELGKEASPHPEDLERQIKQIKQKKAKQSQSFTP